MSEPTVLCPHVSELVRVAKKLGLRLGSCQHCDSAWVICRTCRKAYTLFWIESPSPRIRGYEGEFDEREWAGDAEDCVLTELQAEGC